jgi:sugar lactone lactonase YvrE
MEMHAWTPPKDAGLAGAFARNDRLAAARRIAVPGEGPEDVLVLDDGRVIYGLVDGRVMASAPDGSHHEVLAETGGRPLGLEQHPDGSIVVCDAVRGLLTVAGGSVEVLADRFEGEPFLFTNNAAVASDGTIYFSVSSRRFGIEVYRSDILEHSNTGRLFRRDPGGDLHVLADGLSFANGVALSADESSVFVAETGEYRIRRIPADGGGSPGLLVENLPGIPDNLTASGGIVWAAMFTPRNRPLDLLLPRPRLRSLVARLPEKIQPQPVRHGFVVGFDEATGDVVHNLQDPSGAYAPITSARAADGRLWLGSLTEPAIAFVDLG